MKNLNFTEPRGFLVTLLFNLMVIGSFAQTVTGFTLVNASNNSDIQTLLDGSTVFLPDLPLNINIRAEVEGPVGSVRFFLNGAVERTENVAPYALAGDINGDYLPWNPSVGSYELTATPFSGTGASGSQGTGLTITFLLSEDGDDEVLVSDIAFTNCPEQLLVVGDEVDLDVAITPTNANNQTIAFTASDGLSVDFLSGEFTARAPGEITVTATSFSNGAVSDRCSIGIIEAPATPVDPYVTVEAASFDFQKGVEAPSPDAVVGSIDDGDYLRFEIVEFGRGPASGSLRATSNGESSTVEFRIGAADGLLIASCDIPGDNPGVPQAYPIDVLIDYGDGTSFLSTQTLFVVFRGTGTSFLELENFVFESADVLVTDVTFINCPEQLLVVGDEVDLDVAITPANATNQTIAFTASDGLSVDFLSGEFTARAPGEITVTATSFSNGAASDQCNIGIIDAPATPVDPYATVEAGSFDFQQGVEVTSTTVGSIDDGDYLRLRSWSLAEGLQVALCVQRAWDSLARWSSA